MYIDKNGTKKGHVRNNDVIQVSIETFVLKKKGDHFDQNIWFLYWGE